MRAKTIQIKFVSSIHAFLQEPREVLLLVESLAFGFLLLNSASLDLGSLSTTHASCRRVYNKLGHRQVAIFHFNKKTPLLQVNSLRDL
jgi:hypothetical protein